MAKGIFISYRRDDARHAAGRVADELSNTFGAEHVFRDVEGIELGLDFVDSLENALAKCSVMLVLIGRHWLDITDAKDGKRRLDNPHDWIRQEIATALNRKVRVVPVLLEGAGLPDGSELPKDLRPLVRRQALELADVSWRGDVRRLTEMLSKLPEFSSVDKPVIPPTPPPAPPPTPTPTPSPTPSPTASPDNKSRKSMWIGVAALIVVLGAIGNWWDESGAGVPAPPLARTGLPSGYGMKVCGCWGPNPAWTAPEPQCLSGRVRVNVCPASCSPGHPQYAYVCE